MKNNISSSRRNHLKRLSVLPFFSLLNALPPQQVQAQMNADKPIAKVKTLVLVSHPYPEKSFFTKSLEAAARQVDNVTVRNLESVYTFDIRAINVDEEKRLMREHHRVVFMFPTHWFNITPMMKAYLNDVWGNVGPDLWKGKEMLVITQAAGGASTYGPTGRTGVRLADIFLPMKATAAHTGMTYLPPLAFEAASRANITHYQAQVIARLTE